MTVIDLPGIKGDDGRLIAPVHFQAYLIDKLHTDYNSGVSKTIEIYARPAIALAPPPLNMAWDCTIVQGSQVWEKNITFSGEHVVFESLSNIDPQTLNAYPYAPAQAEWDAVLDQIEDAKLTGVQSVFNPGASTWTVPNPYTRRPGVALYRLDGTQIYSDVYADEASVIVTFPAPQSGYIVLN